MMRAIRLAAACVAVLTLATGQVQGAMVTVDPDGLTAGTSLTSLFPGVTITQGNGGTGITSALGITGTQQFSYQGSTWWFTWLPSPPLSTLSATLAASSYPQYILRFDFDTPTDFVSVDLIPNDSYDPGSIAAFDGLGNLVGYQSFPGVNQYGVRNTLTVSGAGIKTLLAGGYSGDNVDIDTLKYNDQAADIPEPSTLLLWSGLGAIGLALAWRRRKRAA